MKRLLVALVAALTFASGCQICDGDPEPMRPIEVCSKRVNPSCRWISQ
jgi:hypothetical protein